MEKEWLQKPFFSKKWLYILVLNLKSDKDHFPLVKLFTPDAQATWLFTDLDSEFPDIAYGLCDLGMGFPELGDLYICPRR